MNGLVIPNTPIVVDYWNSKNVHPRSLFFLSHMHADHTSGLNEFWAHRIYCTKLTGKLLAHKLHIRQELIVELPLEEPTIVSVSCPGERVNITVTALDANHCPGSAMFLFEGYFGRILYTGDFRYVSSMLEYPALNGSCTIDQLYLDNTYCDRQCRFPSREAATETVISLIKEQSNSTVILFGVHTLGKESLLEEVGIRLQTWIGVSEERYKTLEILGVRDIFSRDISECRLRVYPQYMIAKSIAPEMKEDDDEDYLAILPTCLYTGRGAPPRPPRSPLIKIVEYSDHSSFNELREFVRAIKPKKVLPIVRSFTGDKSITHIRCDMSVFDQFLDKSPAMDTRDVPASIKNMLSGQFELTRASPFHHNPRRSLVSLRPTRRTPKGVQYLSPYKKSSQEAHSSAREDNSPRREELVLAQGKENVEEMIVDSGSEDDCLAAPTSATTCARAIPLLDLPLKRLTTHIYGPMLTRGLRPHPPPVLAIKQEKEDAYPNSNNQAPVGLNSFISSEGPPSDYSPSETSSSNSDSRVSESVVLVNESRGNPHLKGLTIPLTSVSTLAGQAQSTCGSTVNDDFLADFPFKSIKRRLVEQPIQIDHAHCPALFRGWDSTHRIDKNTGHCTCTRGKLCLLSLCHNIDLLDTHMA